jgi:hypothetical protein
MIGTLDVASPALTHAARASANLTPLTFFARPPIRPAGRPGWSFDYGSGELVVDANKRSAAAALIARGGAINAPAREVLTRYGMPYMGGYSYSVPLHAGHVAMRGVPSLDCLHYCSFGLPEVRAWGAGGTGGAAGTTRPVLTLPVLACCLRSATKLCCDVP